MALTTSTRKQLWAQIFAMPHKAGAYIANLVDELETRITAAEGDTGGIDTRVTAAEADIVVLQAQRFPAQYAGDALAADVVGETTFAVARAAGSTGTSGIDLVFSGAITADDTNYATITVRCRTGAGAGSATVIATITTKITGGTGNVTAHARIQPTTTNVAIVAGDRLTYEITKAGTGVQLPAMSLTVVETLT